MKEVIISPKVGITISKYQADNGGEYFRILVTSDERNGDLHDISKIMWMAVDSDVFHSKDEEESAFNKAFVEASEYIDIRIRGLFQSCDLVKDLEAKEQT